MQTILIALVLFIFLRFPTAAVAAMEISEAPASTSETEEVTVLVGLSGLTKNATYYLKGSFHKPSEGSTNYFGLTWNGFAWVKNSSGFSEQLPVTTDSQGAALVNLKVKVDTADTGYEGPGSYNLKVARYTASGYLSWSPEVQITITGPFITPSQPIITYSPNLSEFVPAPNKGEKEWVELFNPTDATIDLTSWRLKDGTNHLKELSGTIGPKSYKVFEFASGWLNNTGDKLTLLSPNSTEVESYTYEEIDTALAFAKDDKGVWQITTTPTQGAANKITRPQDTPSKQASRASSNFFSEDGDPSLDFVSAAFGGNFEENLPSLPSGEVAGASSSSKPRNSLATLLFAAGTAFIITGIAWPTLKRHKII